ncbi:MAG: S-layer homology domain-containing protein [Clostridia bacterium]|nr:S-layer homology domain-containing protein [Clostridia bacterium]
MKQMKKIFSFLLVLAMIMSMVPAVLAADGEKEVTSLTISPASKTLCVGEEFLLEATPVYADGAEGKDAAITWESSGTSVATVDDGYVTAVAAGDTTITATAGSKSASCAITVVKNPVTVDAAVSVEFDYDEGTLDDVEEAILETVSPAEAKSVVHLSKKEGTLDPQKTDGTQTLTYSASVPASNDTYEMSEQTVTVEVTVKPIELAGVTSSRNPIAPVAKGVRGTLEAEIEPAELTGSSDLKITWASSSDCVTVDADGNYSAKKAGVATVSVTVEYNGETVTDSCSIKVKPDKPVITKNPTPATVTYVEHASMADLSVDVKAVENVTMTYQWYLNGVAVDGETLAVFNPQKAIEADTSGKDTFTVYCMVTAVLDGDETVKSDAAKSSTVTINYTRALKVELTKPNTTNVKVGDKLTFSAKVMKLGLDGRYTAATKADYDLLDWSVDNGDFLKVSTSGNTFTVTVIGAPNTNGGRFEVKATAKLHGLDQAKASSGIISYKVPAAAAIEYAMTASGVNVVDRDVANAVVNATGGAVVTAAKFQKIMFTNRTNVDVTWPSGYNMSSYYYNANNSTYSASSYKKISAPLFKFTSNATSGSIDYVAYNDDMVIATGTVKFGGSADVMYSVAAGESGTFKAADLLKFYRAAAGGSSATLDCVTFSPASYTMVNLVGTGKMGTLYTSAAANATAVRAVDKFYYTPTATQYALNSVTYTASASSARYVVYIPFTAHGSYFDLDGYVAISVNDSLTVTMLGASFKTLGVEDQILADNTSVASAIEYVQFSASADAGKLYYNYSSIRTGDNTPLAATDKVYLTGTSTTKVIDKVYFVPAAGCKDTVTISYTMYNYLNTKLGTGKISISVSKKTASSIFRDITASNTGSWSADAIDFLASNGIIKGTSSTTFTATANMKRCDFVVMMYRLAGEPSVRGYSNPFTDVKTSDYYYDAVLWAYYKNVVTGTSKTTFNPQGNITREQIAAILYRYSVNRGTVLSTALSGFYDANKVSSYAVDAMRWAVSNGIITGSGYYLNPTNNATRAEVAAMLHRFVTK